MKRPRRWWAIWDYDEPARSLRYVRARRPAEARRVYGRELWLHPKDCTAEMLECAPVTADEAKRRPE